MIGVLHWVDLWALQCFRCLASQHHVAWGQDSGDSRVRPGAFSHEDFVSLRLFRLIRNN